MNLNFVASGAATGIASSMAGNGVYDPGLTLSNEQPQFYDLKIAQYQYALVMEVWIHATVTNNEAFALGVGIAGTNELITATNSATCRSLLCGFGTGERQLAPATGAPSTVSLSFKCRNPELWGFPSVYQNLTFCNTNAANPTNLQYLQFVILSTTGANLTNGATWTASVRYLTRFFARRSTLDGLILTNEEKEYLLARRKLERKLSQKL